MAGARPTITDVATRAGVSKGLVSFALNNRPGVAPQTRERILAAASELGWLPSVRARSLSVARSFALGLVIARDLSIIRGDPFFPAFIAGVESELAPVGQTLVLSIVGSEQDELASYRKLVSDGRVDGVFITDLRHEDPRIALALELGLPAVTLGHPEGESPFPAVSMDDSVGMEEAVLHLVGLGHRRIAHVAGPTEMLHGNRRRQAFQRTMEREGLDSSLIVESDFTAAQGARATSELLALAEPPSAIVYANDPMAIAGLGVAQRLGFRVPADVSITGFDGTETGEYLFPALSTVATDAVSWGRAAARALLRSIANEEIEDTELPRARFIARESTGPYTRPNNATAR